MDETFLGLLKPKADRLFFVPKEQSTLFYKEHIQEKLLERFTTELAAPPTGATNRTNGNWIISAPNFVRKTGRRIQWTSRIEVNAEASRAAYQLYGIEDPSLPERLGVNLATDPHFRPISTSFVSPNTGFLSLNETKPLSSLLTPAGNTDWGGYIPTVATPSAITHRGIDVYEVLWSTDVTTSRELRRPSIDEIRHVGPTWEQVT